VKHYAEAQELWAGKPFADVPATFSLTAAATALTELRLTALEESVEVRLADGTYPDLAAELTEHVAASPLRERLAAQLMLALERSGRRAEALSVFRTTRERLVEELGVEPGAELQQQHQRVLRADPVAVTKVSRTASQLPMGVQVFVGREAQLSILEGTAKLAAITGTAGAGKSALALHWAHRVRERYPDGQLFVNLRGFDPELPATDPADALAGFLEALGVSADQIPRTVDARSGLFRSLLDGKRVLLVLDNARDEAQVRPLLPGSPGSLAVVTSRDQLSGLVAVEGALPVTLGMLNSAEALTLLTSRLGSARLAGQRKALHRIVSRCAGLPLALAVVAASSAVQPGFTLDMIASDLDSHPLDALGSNDPQADLRSVFSWSYRALSPAAANMFRLLGLHPGPDISVTAAARLADCSVASARRFLLELNRAQLTDQVKPGRFSLHDLLKVYSRELAQDLDPTAPQQRLLAYYLRTSLVAAHLLDPHRQPIIPHADSLPGLSTYDEAMAWFDAEHQVLMGIVDRTGSWQLAWAMSTFQRRRNHGGDWLRSQRRALAAAQEARDVTGQANAAFQLAMAEFRHGSPHAADEAIDVAAQHFASLNDDYGLASTYHLRCLRTEATGDYTAAFRFAVKGFRHYRRARHLAGQGRALGAMGWYQAKLGRLGPGLAYSQAALALSQKANDLGGLANAWDSIGHLNLQLGNLALATDSYARSTRIYRDLGDRYNLVNTLIGLGDVQSQSGAEPAAWHEALTIATELRHPAEQQLRHRLEHTALRQ
jgi:tetratricopeptide (TPR) repeat protein/Fe2+ transport system protein FeoA